MSLSMRKIKNSHFHKWQDWHTYTDRYFASSGFYIFQNISGWTLFSIGRSRQRVQTHYRTTFPGSIFYIVSKAISYLYTTVFFQNNTHRTDYKEIEISKTGLPWKV
jgi:hypothetical protein